MVFPAAAAQWSADPNAMSMSCSESLELCQNVPNVSRCQEPARCNCSPPQMIEALWRLFRVFGDYRVCDSGWIANSPLKSKNSFTRQSFVSGAQPALPLKTDWEIEGILKCDCLQNLLWTRSLTRNRNAAWAPNALLLTPKRSGKSCLKCWLICVS